MSSPILAFAKLFFLFAILIYIIFAGVVVRQVYLMIETVSLGLDGFIKVLAWAHLLFALGVFIFAALYL